MFQHNKNPHLSVAMIWTPLASTKRHLAFTLPAQTQTNVSDAHRMTVSNKYRNAGVRSHLRRCCVHLTSCVDHVRKIRVVRIWMREINIKFILLLADVCIRRCPGYKNIFFSFLLILLTLVLYSTNTSQNFLAYNIFGSSLTGKYIQATLASNSWAANIQLTMRETFFLLIANLPQIRPVLVRFDWHDKGHTNVKLKSSECEMNIRSTWN